MWVEVPKSALRASRLGLIIYSCCVEPQGGSARTVDAIGGKVKRPATDLMSIRARGMAKIPTRIITTAIVLAMTVVGVAPTQAADPSEPPRYLYTTNHYEGWIDRVDIHGKNVESSFIPGPSTGPVAIDVNYLYWRTQAPPDGSGALSFGIGRAKHDGSVVEQHFIADIQVSGNLAISDSHIYWTEFPNRISRARLDGTGVENQFVTVPGQVDSIAIARGKVYWADGSNGRIGSMNLDGSDVDESLVAGLGLSRDLAANDSHIFWVDSNSHVIGRARHDGSELRESLIPDMPESTTGIAVDSEYLYWAVPGEGRLERARVDGTEIDRDFVSRIEAPNSIAVTPERKRSVPVSPAPADVVQGENRQAATSHCISVNKAKSIPRVGSRILVKAGCRTGNGQRVGVKVKSRMRGDMRSFRLYCQSSVANRNKTARADDGSRYCKRGALKIRTFGRPQTLSIFWSAPASPGFLPYAMSATSRT